MIVLKAETALAVAEALADDVAGGVFPPAIRVATWHHIGFSPAQTLGFGVEEPRPLLFVTRTMWRRRTHLSLRDLSMSDDWERGIGYKSPDLGFRLL